MLDSQLAFLKTTVPQIPPPPAGGPRPFWSVLIPAYGRADLIERALDSVLAQDRGPSAMDITVLDDCSPDEAIGAVVRRLGRDRVRYHRRPRNLGQFANVNAGIAEARGEWIHVLHDDDWIEEGFYARLEAGLAQADGIGAALTAIRIVSQGGTRSTDWPLLGTVAGPLDDVIARFASAVVVQTPAVVVCRATYEVVGGYHATLGAIADWEMWQRIACHYPWWYEPGVRAVYREHEATVSGGIKRTGRNVAEARAAIAFAQNYLPPAQAAALKDRALSFWAMVAARTAVRMLRQGDYVGAAAQLRECLTTEPSERMVKAIISLERYLAPNARPSGS